MTALSPTQIELFAYQLEVRRELVISLEYTRELLRGYNPGVPDERQSPLPLPCRLDHRNPASEVSVCGYPRMLAAIHQAIAQLEAMRNMEGTLAALCDSNRLMREFMVLTSVSTSG